MIKDSKSLARLHLKSRIRVSLIHKVNLETAEIIRWIRNPEKKMNKASQVTQRVYLRIFIARNWNTRSNNLLFLVLTCLQPGPRRPICQMREPIFWSIGNIMFPSNQGLNLVIWINLFHLRRILMNQSVNHQKGV